MVLGGQTLARSRGPQLQLKSCTVLFEILLKSLKIVVKFRIFHVTYATSSNPTSLQRTREKIPRISVYYVSRDGTIPVTVNGESYAWENFRELHSIVYVGIKVSRY